MKQTDTYRSLLRYPDATDATEVDPLSAAASGFEEPKFPVLAPDRIVRCKIVKVTKSITKETASLPPSEQREVLSFKFQTEKDYTDTAGKPLRAGFKGFKHIGITPSEETSDKRARTIQNIGEDLSMALKACGLGGRSPRELLNDPTMVESQIVDLKVGLNKAQGGYPESNSFTFVLPG